MQLEVNIRCIALSGNWFKLVDDWFLETSMIQNAPSAVGTTIHKRGPGRRSRKQSVSEVPSHDRSAANFLWFRGGRSKLVFQRAALPRCIVAKAARQGNDLSKQLHFSLTYMRLIDTLFCLLQSKKKCEASIFCEKFYIDKFLSIRWLKEDFWCILY